MRTVTLKKRYKPIVKSKLLRESLERYINLNKSKKMYNLNQKRNISLKNIEVIQFCINRTKVKGEEMRVGGIKKMEWR